MINKTLSLYSYRRNLADANDILFHCYNTNSGSTLINIALQCSIRGKLYSYFMKFIHYSSEGRELESYVKTVLIPNLP